MPYHQEPLALNSHLKQVLVVDDDEGVRQTLKLLLEELFGFAVVLAEDGRAGWEAYQAGRFDLVITDYEMPHLKGDKMALRIKEAAATQPVIMVTAYEHKARGPHNPSDVVLLKPFDIRDLETWVNRLVATTPAHPLIALSA